MRALLIVLLAVIWQSGVHAELYKWKDAEGNLIFSDRPEPGHSKEESQVDETTLPQIISVPPPEASTSSSHSTSRSGNGGNGRYKNVIITQPEDDTSVRENSGKVYITVQVEPHLFVENGDKLQIYLDGTVVYKGEQTSVVLDNIDRGTHRVKARIINSRGGVVKETGVTSFTLQRFHI